MATHSTLRSGAMGMRSLWSPVTQHYACAGLTWHDWPIGRNLGLECVVHLFRLHCLFLSHCLTLKAHSLSPKTLTPYVHPVLARPDHLAPSNFWVSLITACRFGSREDESPGARYVLRSHLWSASNCGSTRISLIRYIQCTYHICWSISRSYSSILFWV